MTDYVISEKKKKELESKMSSLGIEEKDILEKFVRSSGHGGQNVNKTATCVYLKHMPTGIEVKCMKERSQNINRFFARRELIEKIESQMGIKTGRDIKIERIRQRKAKKGKRSRIKYGRVVSETDRAVIED